MIFTPEYSIKMSMPQTVLTAIIGILTVLLILAVIDLLIMLVSKLIRAIEDKNEPKEAETIEKKPETEKAAENENVELVGIDEPTAAVVMAIVSDKTGIPLERLKFKSIKAKD